MFVHGEVGVFGMSSILLNFHDVFYAFGYCVDQLSGFEVEDPDDFIFENYGEEVSFGTEVEGEGNAVGLQELQEICLDLAFVGHVRGEIKGVRVPDLDEGTLIDGNAKIKEPVHLDEPNWVLMEGNCVDNVGGFLYLFIFTLLLWLVGSNNL